MNFSRSGVLSANPLSNRFVAAMLATFAALIITTLGTSQWASADGGTTAPTPVPDPEPTSGLNAPRHVTARAGDESAAVTWIKPAESDTELPEILGYVVTAVGPVPGISVETDVDDTLVIVEDLENGVEYTFTVVAFNSDGEGAVSEPSNAITPEEGLELDEEQLERLQAHLKKRAREAAERLRKAQERAREQLAKNKGRIENWLEKQNEHADRKLNKTIEKANEQDQRKAEKARNWLDRLKEQLGKKLERAEGTERYDDVKARVDESIDKAEHKLVDRLEKSSEKTDARIAKAEEKVGERIEKAEDRAENMIERTEERLSEKVSKFRDRFQQLIQRLRRAWAERELPSTDAP
jgi:hypothetical protein